MTATDGRGLCLIFLNSVGDGLRWLLPMSDTFNQRYSLLANVSYESAANYEAFSPDQIGRCDLLICHPPEEAPFANGAGYAQFLGRFSAATQKIYLPRPRFAALWPYYIAGPSGPPLPITMYQPFWPHYRSDPAPSDPDRPTTIRGEMPSFPFGDRYVLDLLQKGLSPAEVVPAYLNLDIAAVTDLDGLASTCVAALERHEGSADIKIADFVAGNFRRSKLFVAPKLASNQLLLYLANAILQLLKLPPLPGDVLAQLQRLIKIEAPIHPSVGQFFCSSGYAGPTTRYLVDRHRLLTFAEYLSSYVDWLVAAGGGLPAGSLGAAASEAAGVE